MSMLTSHGVVVATAMAVSGTFILLALRLQKNLPVTQFAGLTTPLPRSCISTDGKRREKKKKRVHFADDVVDPIGNSEEFRKKYKVNYVTTLDFVSNPPVNKNTEMPANRAALYQGLLKNQVVHRRFAYSY